MWETKADQRDKAAKEVAQLKADIAELVELLEVISDDKEVNYEWRCDAQAMVGKHKGDQRG
jgi:hypothetical protein